jgi:HEAT repeat protein
MAPTALVLVLLTPLVPGLTGGQPPGAPAQPAGRDKDEQAEKIRGMLRDFEFGRHSFKPLVGMGAKAFPVYEAILADPKSDPDSVARIFVVLEHVDADRGRFGEPAVRWLISSEWEPRLSTVRCLGKIGSSQELAPVVALLADEHPEVVVAARTLVAIGDQRALAAMDIWLNSGSNAATRRSANTSPSAGTH